MESWGGNLEDEPWSLNRGGGLMKEHMKEQSWRRHLERSGSHLGTIFEAFGMHLGVIWEAFGKPLEDQRLRGHLNVKLQIVDTPLSKNAQSSLEFPFHKAF